MKRMNDKEHPVMRSMRKYKGKVLVILSIAILACLAVKGIGEIKAYMADADRKENPMVIGGNRVELVEDFEPPEAITPGVTFKKDVSVRNVGPNSCYIRAKAVFTDGSMEKYCSIDWNTTDWAYNSEDNYYYYIQAVPQGERTASLLTAIAVSPDIPAEEIKDFDVLVYTESYQQGKFTDYQDAWAYYLRNKNK